jgi:hypothetical protein
MFEKKPDDKPLQFPTLEANIRRSCDERMRRRGAYVVQVNADERGPSGAPDRVYCYKGRFIAVEYKRDMKSKPTPLQLRHFAAVLEAGGYAIIARNWEDIDMVLSSIDKEIIL